MNRNEATQNELEPNEKIDWKTVETRIDEIFSPEVHVLFLSEKNIDVGPVTYSERTGPRGDRIRTAEVQGRIFARDIFWQDRDFQPTLAIRQMQLYGIGAQGIRLDLLAHKTMKIDGPEKETIKVTYGNGSSGVIVPVNEYHDITDLRNTFRFK